MWIYNPTAGEAETEGSGGPGWPGSLAEPVNSRFNHTHMRAHMHSHAQAHILLAVESLLISAHCHLRLPLLLVCRPASDIHPRLQSPPQATRCQVETLKFPGSVKEQRAVVRAMMSWGNTPLTELGSSVRLIGRVSF